MKTLYPIVALALLSSGTNAADVKISALPSASALGGTEALPGVQSAATVKITANQIRTFVHDAINILDYGVTAAASDNATGLQNAINAAVSAGRPLYIPSAGSSGCYKYTAPLTVSGNLRIFGDYVSENWNGGINAPLGTPTIGGSVLCPSSNGSAGISLTATSINLSLEHIGIRFQTAFSGTGDGISYLPTSNAQGLSGAVWDDVVISGHDGDHYAVNLQNPIYGTFKTVRTYGGGGFKLYGNNTGNYGNMVFVHPTAMVIAGGAANGFDLSASGAQKLNLITMIRPQANVINDTASPAGNPATSAQYTWKMDTNVTNVRLTAPDMETNVSANWQWGAAGKGNDPDWPNMFNTSANFYVPAWTTNGLQTGEFTRTITDSTSSGAVGATGANFLSGTTWKASSATTYAAGATLMVAPPIASTNVTFSRTAAIYATGEIYTTADLGAGNGLFVTGTSQINNNSGAATNIGGNSSSTFKFPNLLISGTSPTVTSGLGTSPSVTANGTGAFKITVGASGSPATAEVLGMPTASNGWVCTAYDLTTTARSAKQTATTTTSVTITWDAAPSLSDVIVHQCSGF